MSKPIIQSLWIGGSLSKMEQLCVASFLANDHEFHLYTYGDVAGIPEGTIIKDANEIIPERDIFTYSGGSYAGFADWFRWALLYQKGNFWVDTDVICLKPYHFDSDIIFGHESESLVCPAVLGFPAGHELSDFLEKTCCNPHNPLPYDSRKTRKRKFIRRLKRKDRSQIEWGEAGGPEGFTKALNYFNLFDKAKPFTYFYPIHYSNWNTVFDNTLVNDICLFSDSYSIHLWNEMSRRCKGFDKNGTFHHDSLFEQLKRKYGVS